MTNIYKNNPEILNVSTASTTMEKASDFVSEEKNKKLMEQRYI
jgi:hypothetical protein